MKNRTVKLNLTTSLPMNEKYCDGCPALGERYCNQLNVSLECEELTGKTDRLLAHRSTRCPFNAPVCYVCKGKLEPKQVGKHWEIAHTCTGTNVMMVATGNEFETCVNAYEQNILNIKNAFRQR